MMNSGWRPGKRILATGVAVIVLLLLVIWNFSVFLPAQAAIGKDARNQGISIFAYRTWIVSPTGLTIELWEMKNDKTPVDLLRAFMQISASLKGKHFKDVTLMHKGKAIFVMTGSDFATLGESFDDGQNPLYLMRTLPSELRRPDGTDAFPTYTGGWLGVMSKQISEVTDFTLQWASGDSTATAHSNSSN